MAFGFLPYSVKVLVNTSESVPQQPVRVSPGPDGVELSAAADDELLDWDQNQNPQQTHEPEQQNQSGTLAQQLRAHFRFVFAALEPIQRGRLIATVRLLLLVLLGSDSADCRVSLHRCCCCCCQRKRKRRRDKLQQRRIAVMGGARNTNPARMSRGPAR